MRYTLEGSEVQEALAVLLVKQEDLMEVEIAEQVEEQVEEVEVI
jgi:hypothetical protein